MEQRGVWLFLGPDRVRKRQRIHELSRILCIDTLDRHDLDGATVRAAELIALCRQRPAVSPVRLIVLDQAQRVDPDGVQALLHHASSIAETACVVLLVERELSMRHPLARAAHEGAIGVLRFAGREASPPRPFALVDALGARDVSGCLQALREQIVLGKEPTEVMGLVAWQVQRWLAVRRLLDARYAPQRIATVAGLRAWQVDRIRSEISGRSLASLRETLTRCWKVEAEIKSGRTLPWLAIERLLLELCLEGRASVAGGRGRVGDPVRV